MIIIHGYGNGFQSIIRKRKGDDGGFKAFSKEIKNNIAHVYNWYIKEDYSLIDTINPYKYLSTYFAEKKKSISDENLSELNIFLEKSNPDKIICHSMGCYLLLNYLKKYKLPNSVKKIYLVQADVSKNFDTKYLEKLNVDIYNYYCFWDPTLYLSGIISKHKSAGLFGFKSKKIKNIFWPLYKTINLHMSTICDKDFANIIIKT